MKKLTQILSIILIFSLLGCATKSSKSLTTAINPNMGYVVIHSQPDSTWQRNTSIGAALIVVDDKEISKLTFGHQAFLQLKPGIRKIKIFINDSYPLIPVFLKLNLNWQEDLVIEMGQKINLTLIYKTADSLFTGEKTPQVIGMGNSQTYMFKSRMEEPNVDLSF